MISEIDFLITKSDIILGFSIVVLLNIFESIFINKQLFNDTWLNESLGIVLGFSLHGLITNRISYKINKKIDRKKIELRQSIYDIIRFTTVFITQYIIINLINNNFSNTIWLEEGGLMIIGFIIYNHIKKHIQITKNNKFKYIISDILKLSLGNLLAFIIIDGNLTYNKFINYVGRLTGLIVYHIIAQNYGLSEENFSLIKNKNK